MNKLLLIALFFIIIYAFIKIGTFIFRFIFILGILLIGYQVYNNKFKNLVYCINILFKTILC